MPTRKAEAQRIVLFNHKGGVGKTTLTVNIAHALADLGKRVLVVDTDPQCSVSSFFLEESYLDKTLDQSEGPDGQTLWASVRPLSEGTGPPKEAPLVRINHNLHLLVGDIRLSEFESMLSDAWNLCLMRNRRGYACMAAISQIVDKASAKVKADIILYDVGPNSGALNRSVVLDCSHIIVPAACDLFSSRALKTLGFSLETWVGAWARIAEMAPVDAPVIKGRPDFLGFIPQGFSVYRGAMSSVNVHNLIDIEQRIVDFVWTPLQRAKGLPLSPKPSRIRLGQVKYFGTLVTKAQNQGVPLWEATGANTTTKAKAKETFRDLAQRIRQSLA